MDAPNRDLDRRQFLGRAAAGLGAAALQRSAPGAGPGAPHHLPRARRVIYLLQNGAPPHVEMFDHKPRLAAERGRELPESIHRNQRQSTMTSGKKRPCLGAMAGFRQYGDSGAWLCDYLPHTASIADQLCFVKSMHTNAVNHAPAISFCLSGAEQPGRPSFGAWLSYWLGSDAPDLPGFVVLTSRDREASCGQMFYDFYWGSGFLPSRFQGVKFRGSGDPVLYLSNPPGVSRRMRRDLLDRLAKLNGLRARAVGDPEIDARTAQFDMAYRMQESVPELTDLSTEPRSVLEMYGPDVERRGSYANNCLMARRLAERGVRFVQLFHAGWDHHTNLPTQFRIQCRDTDQPSAALVKDLEQRGLLDDTLVIWGGEFGRTPFGQGDIDNPKTHGRDHHPYGWTIWMAGGGVRPGLSYGATDEYGYNVVEDPVSVHDLQATALHLCGLDHERVTFRFQGRQFRLTDVHGRVVHDLLA